MANACVKTATRACAGVLIFKRCVWYASTTSAFVLLTIVAGQVFAQQPAQGQSTPSAVQPVPPAAQPAAQPAPNAQPSAQAQGKSDFRPRLPMYYAKVVDEKQRQKIYGIQKKYHPKIAELQKQLEQLIAQRDAEIEAVLTAEQKAEIEKLRQEASQRRKEKSDAAPSAEANPSSQQ